MDYTKEITSETLRSWLEENKSMTILDVRPLREREEWHIPGSIHADVYDKLKAKDPGALMKFAADRSKPVVTVCAGGKTSLLAAEILQSKGYEAYSLYGGMKSWSQSWNIARKDFANFAIIQFRRTGKGCLSYMIISSGEAMMVDASLQPEVYQDIIAEGNLSLKYVMDTHIHADHLSRSLKLAEHNKIKPHLPANKKLTYAFNPVLNNQEFMLGKITIKALHTPGHTYESTSYLVDNEVMLTGDTLFIDNIGRPDLKAEKEEAIKKSGLLYQSLQALSILDENIMVMPGHTSQPVPFDQKIIASPLKDIKKKVSILQMDEPSFIDHILQRIPPTPANYLTIVEHNISGDFSDVNPLDLEAGANRCAIS